MIPPTTHLEALTAVSPIDGRYRATAEALAPYFSEYALMTMRVTVECEYLTALSETKGIGIRPLTADEKKMLRALPQISIEDAQIIKKIERDGFDGIPATNHDVKAVEYFIKLKLRNSSLTDVLEWVHFALTSEDVNSTAHALALRGALEAVMLPALGKVENEIVGLARAHADTAMLARTHGQSATPTTFGKEMNVFARRLEKQVTALKNSSILVKWGGPSGNYNAQMVALPKVDWLAFARSFAERLNAQGADKGRSVRLALNEVTTQIEPHDTYAARSSPTTPTRRCSTISAASIRSLSICRRTCGGTPRTDG
jgi:adenylosuccinate lyase